MNKDGSGQGEIIQQPYSDQKEVRAANFQLPEGIELNDKVSVMKTENPGINWRLALRRRMPSDIDQDGNDNFSHDPNSVLNINFINLVADENGIIDESSLDVTEQEARNDLGLDLSDSDQFIELGLEICERLRSFTIPPDYDRKSIREWICPDIMQLTDMVMTDDADYDDNQKLSLS